MTLERIGYICFCIVITSAVATGQPRSETAGQGQPGPGTSVSERTYPAGGIAGWRRVQIRSESGSGEVAVETVEVRDPERRLAPIQEIATETIRTTPDTAQTRRDVFRLTADRRRTLLETTESLQETLPNGDTSAIHNTWAPDLNGRHGLTSRQIEQGRSAAPDVQQTDTTLLAPRGINPGVVRHDSAHLVRDVNGRWQPSETRRGEIREIGASERIEEEMIQRPAMNGNLAVDERNVTRRYSANEQDHEVIETYGPYADGWPRSNNRLSLSQRVHRTTTATADGGRYTVEEVVGRSRVASDDPMRVIRRTVTTVRRIGTDRWVTERQVFERDVNGRLQLVTNDAEERGGE